MSELLTRITVDPKICHGRPHVRGTRIMVWLVLQYLANGDSIDDVLGAFPSLTREDIQACLAFAAEMTKERVLPIEADALYHAKPVGTSDKGRTPAKHDDDLYGQ
jgi:uncharacterized protein (DUF433 family)